jgi:holo-[acyl-carrier protein] synthase
VNVVSEPQSERAQLAARLLGDAANKAIPTGLVLGVDVVDIPTLKHQLRGDLGSRFEARVFTPKEIADCRGQVAKFASRWAIKEAVSKAIGTGFREGLRPSMIEVTKLPTGSVSVGPSRPDIQWPRGAHLWEWSISAAHEKDVAVAVAVAQTETRVGLTKEAADEHHGKQPVAPEAR